ncbi:MAG: four-carbon acid sugar kinase family protein [Candidatus Gastranaerophilaceae bacterium]
MIISDMIGIIADDLTDANETALQFHLRGANSQILLDFDSSPQNIKNTQVWAVSTATRNKPAEYAEAEVKKATQLFLENLNLDYFFKKIASTLNGNIGVETLAMLEVLDWDAAILIPAYPAENKITVGGYQLVKGIPIERTEFARDIMNPLFESHVPTLIKKQIGIEKADLVDTIDLQTIMKGAGPVLQKLNSLVKSGKKLIIADAVSITDIEQIILAGKKSNFKFLPVGTAAVAQVLGNIWLPPLENQFIAKNIPELPKLILSGTGTQTTITQLEVLDDSEDYDNTYFIELDMNTVLGGVRDDIVDRIVNNLGEKNIVVVNASNLIKNFDGFSDDSFNTDMTKTKLMEHVSSYLAELTMAVTNRRDVILITLGGETSYKCCTAINSNQLQIIDEIAPAVALTLDHKAQWIVSKSGHIGNSNSLIEILRYFDLHVKL